MTYIISILLLLVTLQSDAVEIASRPIMEVRCASFASIAKLDQSVAIKHLSQASLSLSRDMLIFQGGWAEGYLYSTVKSKDMEEFLAQAKIVYASVCLNFDNAYEKPK
jgi:hypothetical protein